MRLFALLLIALLPVAACAQTGGDIGRAPPSIAAGMGPFELPPRPDKALNKPTNDALDKPVEKISLHDTPLSAALEGFAKDAHVPMSVDWETLEGAGLTRNKPLTIELSQIPARRGLTSILELAGGNVSLAFMVHNNQVVVSTKDQLQSSRYQQVIVYNLSSFFFDWDFESPEAARAAQNLIDTIQNIVDVSSWRDNGGTVGTARMIGGQLIVNQTLENHDRIAEILTELTEKPAHPTRAYDVRDLIKDDPAGKVPALIAAIETNCGRDTWRDHGGKTSSVAFFDGKLFITTRSSIHDQIEQFLKLMRQ